MTLRCTFICDIKSSRSLKNWRYVFSSIETTLNEVNKKFKEEIFVEFKPTVGDEFQGVLKSPKCAYDIYLFLKQKIPADFYCGIGVGEVEKAKNEAGMRGTAFYRAREALETCKKKKRNVIFSSEDELFDRIVNTVFYFMESIESSWTVRQREIILFYRENRLTYEEVGKYFGVSRQAIYKILKEAHWKAVEEGEELLRQLFNPSGFTSLSKISKVYNKK